MVPRLATTWPPALRCRGVKAAVEATCRQVKILRKITPRARLVNKTNYGFRNMALGRQIEGIVSANPLECNPIELTTTAWCYVLLAASYLLTALVSARSLAGDCQLKARRRAPEFVAAGWPAILTPEIPGSLRILRMTGRNALTGSKLKRTAAVLE
ncbi:hypothetical protein Bbelb_405110 [Branchiostoma belcheri]|nr:hypothetical protein Bbelb_405110 [Branchiostoma belcheri]